MFDLAATVHDHFKTGIPGDLGSFLANYAELEPQDLGLDFHGLAGDVGCLSRRAKNIDDINRSVNFVETSKDPFAEDSLPGLTWVTGTIL
jgi:hypothetical protein